MKPKKILLADDDHALLAVMRTRLEAEGFEVITAQDGYQSLALARAALPDAVVLDVNMPAGSGFSVNDRLNDIGELSGTPVIFITGESSDGVRRSMIERGVPSILHKPFTGRELVDAVREALGYWVTRRLRDVPG